MTPPQTLSFEVASIRPHRAEPHERTHIYSSSSASSFRATNVTLKALVQYAFEIPESRILSGPAWMASDRFDIDAKGDEAADVILAKLPADEAKRTKLAMVQALLHDRFQLSEQRETRDLPVYDLVVAKGGVKLKAAQQGGLMINAGRDALSGTGFTTGLLAQELARYAGRVVIDQTGLDLRFNVDLRWKPDDAAADDDRMSLFSVLQEQIGLKLEPARGAVGVLVVVGAAQPSAN